MDHHPSRGGFVNHRARRSSWLLTHLLVQVVFCWPASTLCSPPVPKGFIFSMIFVLASLLLSAWVLWDVSRKFITFASPLPLVSGPARDSWLTGNLINLFHDGLAYNFRLVEKYGGVFKVFGLLGEEQLYVSDPRALHQIVVKEQDIFEETDMFIEANRLILGEGLMSTLGSQHAKQRKLLNPVFSLSNMRDLKPIVQPIADKLLTTLVSQLDGHESKEIDMLLWMSRGSLESVCQATMGYSFNGLDPDTPNEYADAVRRLTPAILKLVMLRPLIPFVIRNFSLFWRNKLVDWLPMKHLREMRSITDIMYKTSKRIFEDKKAQMDTLSEHETSPGRTTKDIMSIMLQANAISSETERLTDSEVIAQVSTIIFAGFDTTTTALSRILYILASESNMQARLRSEIRQAQRDHASTHLPYDVLMSLPYLDAMLRETLRMHPPTLMLSRIARKSTTLPLAHPVETPAGERVSSVFVPKDTNIIISILAANQNKEIWGPDASVYKPERWLAESRDEGLQRDADTLRYPGVYGSMMTFLGGGRACIAFKFAEMEIKQIIATLLTQIHFSLPSSVDKAGHKKEIRWQMNGVDVPIIRRPAEDDQTGQLPLDLRLVREDDYM